MISILSKTFLHIVMCLNRRNVAPINSCDLLYHDICPLEVENFIFTHDKTIILEATTSNTRGHRTFLMTDHESLGAIKILYQFSSSQLISFERYCHLNVAALKHAKIKISIFRRNYIHAIIYLNHLLGLHSFSLGTWLYV